MEFIRQFFSRFLDDFGEEEREYLKRFKKLSREVHCKMRRYKEPSYLWERENGGYENGVDFLGKGFGLRLSLKPSLGLGVFKIPSKKDEPRREYTLSELVEFKRGSRHPDTIKCLLRDLDDWTYLVREYAFEYLRGDVKDFDQFEAYVKAKRAVGEISRRPPQS